MGCPLALLVERTSFVHTFSLKKISEAALSIKPFKSQKKDKQKKRDNRTAVVLL